jgi:hypothetical protein
MLQFSAAARVLARSVKPIIHVTGFMIGILALFFGFVIIMAIWSRWRRQMAAASAPPS